MPDFKELGDITVQPGDLTVPYTFGLPACSSAIANDGSIPYGTTISSVVVTAEKADGTVATGLVASSSVASNVVTVNLTYPSTGDGTYHLEFVCTLNTGAKIEFDFNRVKVRDR
uniref:Tail protein n=1 Tax=viral metagenome TaxID=1070528 RepID=A0A6M3MCQ7_9ZZZZ